LEPNNVREMEGKGEQLHPPHLPAQAPAGEQQQCLPPVQAPLWKGKHPWGDNSHLEDCLALGKGPWARCPTSFFSLSTRRRCWQQLPACRESGRAVTGGKLLFSRCLLELIFDLVEKERVGDFVWDLSL